VNTNGRLVVLVGALVLTVLAAGLLFFMKHRQHTASPTVAVTPPSRPARKPVAHPTPATPPAKPKPVHRAAAVHPAAAKPKPQPVAVQHPVKPVAKPKPVTPAARTPSSLAYDGLPKLPPAIARPLAHGKVVVVAIWAPAAKLDAEAVKEARVGAKDAHARFVVVKANTAQVNALATRFSVLHDPAVLVLTPPATLAIELDGFADRETVAEAATSAAASTHQ